MSRRTLTPILALLLATTLASPLAMAAAADPVTVVGDWEGTLDPGGQPKKRIVVHITVGQDGTLGGTIDYPDQDVSGTQITAITYKAPALHFESRSDLTVYDGTMNKDNLGITGILKVSGANMNLVLKRTP